MRSLTTRLVLVAVLLVAVLAGTVSVATTLAMRSYLTHQLDDRLQEAANSLSRPRGPGTGPADDPFGNQQPGTLVAGTSRSGNRAGVVLRAGFANRDRLDDDQVAAAFRASTEPSTVAVPDLGRYRLMRVGPGTGALIVGLPTEDVDDSVTRLEVLALLLTLGGVLVAGGVGLVVVRRQLRPLREVAATADRVSALPLAEGEIDLADRVPERLTDERTEVGQVGAALNTLLDHVETSLDARHRSEQQVRQFVADASHELRTPLATIAGYTELARRQPEEENVRAALTKVEEESGRMTGLVEDMLLLARLDAGRPLAREPVDLTRLLVEAVDDARVLAPDHHWRLRMPGSGHDAPQPVEVLGDEHRLHQVVTNLLTNARKHTPAGTTVTVVIREDGFDVHDDGPGFPPDFVDHAFERFARGGQARERSADREGGAGLGLSLVEAIVRSHGGTVTISSAPTGTTVAVRLR
jgi:two-component system OmpR family sensor kinase